MHLYLLLVASSCVLSAFCAGCLFSNEPGRGESRLAGGLFLGTAYWAACELGWNLAPDAETAFRWMRAAMPGWMFIGPVVLHIFLVSIPAPKALHHVMCGGYAVSAALLVTGWLEPWVLSEAVRTSWGWGYTTGPLYPVFYATTLVGVGAGIALLPRVFGGEVWESSRRQRPFIALGVSVPFLVASLTDAVLPMAGIQVPRLGTLTFAFLGLLSVWNVFAFGYSFINPSAFSSVILASLREGVALLYADGRIRVANEGLARLSGYTRTGLQDMRIDELLGRTPPDLAEELVDAEEELACAGGDRIPVAVSSRVLTDRRGYGVGIVVSLRDLREIEMLRDRLVSSGRLAAVGQLAAGIAHEINNPLAFVRANLAHLGSQWKSLRDAVDGGPCGGAARDLVLEGEELIEESIEGIDRAAEIVRGVRGFSHAGRSEREDAALEAILDDVVHMAAPQLRGRVGVEQRYAELPPVRCSPQQLKQVFLNLVVNAAHAVGEGGHIRIETTRVDGWAQVSIEDDGPGIAPEIQDRIFDPFFTTKVVGEGTGLGLGIAYQIVRSHRGEIRVESEPGRGATFVVRLPLRPTEPPVTGS